MKHWERYLLLLPGLMLLAFSPPVNTVRITSVFGESREDHFHNGVDWGAGEQDVYAVESGKIIFYFDRAEFPHDNYPGSGNYVIIEHTNTRSYYMHLKDGSINKTNTLVNEGAILGRTGDTGHSYGIHLHYTLERVKPLEALNPLKMMKSLPQDRQAPVIESIRLDPETHYLLVTAYDSMPDNANRMGVYWIACSTNGTRAGEYLFDKLIISNTKYILPSGQAFPDTYAGKYCYQFGPLAPGADNAEYTVVAEAADFSGNSARLEKKFKQGK